MHNHVVKKEDLLKLAFMYVGGDGRDDLPALLAE